VVDLAIAGDTTCYVRDDGQVRCKGTSTEGQLGNGSLGGVNGVPTSAPDYSVVKGISDAVKIVGWNSVFCAVTRAGGVACWGRLGNFRALTPVPVAGLSGRALAMQVTLPNQVNGGLFVQTDASEIQWLQVVQANDGTYQLQAAKGAALPTGTLQVTVLLGAAYYRDGEGHLFKESTDTATNKAVLEQFSVDHVTDFMAWQSAGGAQQGYAVSERGDLYCWGACPLGAATGFSSATWKEPKRVPVPKPIARIASTDLALDQDGGAWSWGNLWLNGTSSTYSEPQYIGDLPGLVTLWGSLSGGGLVGLDGDGNVRIVE
jgi:hypothetical protein